MKQNLKLAIAFMCGSIFFGGIGYATTVELKAKATNYTVIVNGEKQKLSEPVILINGKSYLPVRNLAESIGYKVGFKGGVISLDSPELVAIPAPTATQIPVSTPKPTPAPTQHATPKPGVTSTPIPTPDVNNKLVLINAENERHRLEIQRIESDYNNTITYINEQIEKVKRESPVGYFSDSEFQTERNKLQSEQLEIQSKLDSLILDDSWEARSKKEDLAMKLTNSKQKLDLLEEKRTAQLRIRNYEDMLKTHKQNYQNSINEENNLHRSILNNL